MYQPRRLLGVMAEQQPRFSTVTRERATAGPPLVS
jgi:hypothetical protein